MIVKKKLFPLFLLSRASLSVVGRQGALKQFFNLYINNLWGVELACIEQITYYLLMTLWKTYFNQCIYIIIQKIYFTFYFLKKIKFLQQNHQPIKYGWWWGLRSPYKSSKSGNKTYTAKLTVFWTVDIIDIGESNSFF